MCKGNASPPEAAHVHDQRGKIVQVDVVVDPARLRELDSAVLNFASAATHVQRPTLRLRRQKLTQVLPGEVRPQPTSHGSQVIGVRGGIDCGRVSACH
jgi:hypothetical protein